MVSALLLALLSAADVLLASVLQRDRMYLDVLTDGCGVLAWLLHLAALQVLLNTAHRRTRGPPVLFFMVLLLVPNLVLTLMLYCDDEDFLSLTKPFNLARFVLASTRALFFLLYLLAFAFPCVRDAGYSLHVDAEDGSAVEPGGSRPSTGEMVAEDGSGCISRLFYLWLSPLLARGRRGELNRPADVYHLPWKLRTRVVCGHFHQCWEACRGVGIRDRVDQWPKPIARNFRKDDQSSQFQGVLELEGDVGLLRVLHKAFGLRFYLLGVLKVAVNVSTFAGPLLLSTLVNFVEEKGAPLQTGVLCVLGLFLSGLLGSFLQNIFVFEVCKVALSARAALVSAVYGKALRVSSCSLAGFSLGEVVNLMSTDTDRVVNFFNSFHELWSLPFRFAVTLYLLYLQVGVAFLGGLCMVLVLVPLNKFLASRILRSNERMLECKDNRVKVRLLSSKPHLCDRLRHKGL